MGFLTDIRDSSAGRELAQQNFDEIERRATGHTHEQTVPAATWVVNHNLGYRPAACSLWIGDQMGFACFVHINNDTLEVRFQANYTGIFRCR